MSCSSEMNKEIYDSSFFLEFVSRGAGDDDNDGDDGRISPEHPNPRTTYGICCPWMRGAWDLDALGKLFRRPRARAHGLTHGPISQARCPGPILIQLGSIFLKKTVLQHASLFRSLLVQLGILSVWQLMPLTLTF